MMLMHTLPHRFRRLLRGVLENGGLNSGPVTLQWDASVLPTGFDPNVEGTVPAPAAAELTVTALIYFVSARSTQRQFAEFVDGDVIVTFDADLRDDQGNPVELDALRGLSFRLPDGQDYTQQAVGKTAVEYWDAFIGGEPHDPDAAAAREPAGPRMKAATAIRKLKALRAKLLVPVDFFAEHVDEWFELARQTAAATLTNLRPDDVDGETWAARVAAAADRVAARLVRRAPVGVTLAMSDLDAGLPADASAAAQEAYEKHPVTVEEVERWVAAGREKVAADDPGKNLDERDTDETDTQIAWKVLTAINNNRPGGAGLEAAIVKFLELERAAGDIPQELYGQVLVAWVEVFTPVAALAWQGWVRRLVAAL